DTERGKKHLGALRVGRGAPMKHMGRFIFRLDRRSTGRSRLGPGRAAQRAGAPYCLETTYTQLANGVEHPLPRRLATKLVGDHGPIPAGGLHGLQLPVDRYAVLVNGLTI